jgi:thiol-disulfide isomerase/thioredoxin
MSKSSALMALAVLVFAGASCSRVPAEPPPPAGIADLNEDGWRAVQARHHRRILLVNFWATWCEPCREEFPALVRLHNTYRGKGLSVVAISMDEPESIGAVEEFLHSQNARFGSYRHSFRDFGAFVDTVNPKWGGGIPASFLYDRRGQLVSSWLGATSYEEFEAALRPLLP